MQDDSEEGDSSPGDLSIENHPDLNNPEWALRVEREALAELRGAGKAGGRKAGNRRRLTRRGWWAIAGVVAAGAVFVVVVQQRSLDTPPAPFVMPPTGSPDRPATPAAGTVDLARPFAGTPAANWADGANGIVPPTPVAVGRWSAREVGTAEQEVRATLIAAHLDDTMLVRRDPAAFLDSLAPNARSGEARTLASAQTRDDGGTVSLIAPGYRLLPVPINVAGSMSASTENNGTLVVHANYVFAFPFAPAGSQQAGAPAQIIAIEHVDQNFSVPEGPAYRSGDRGVWLDGGQTYYVQMSCAAIAQGYLGPAYSDKSLPNAGPPNENPDALYDPNHSMNITNSCPTGHPI